MAIRRALCIGINDYPGTGSDLDGCVNDAHDWSEALERRGFVVTRLLDADATRARLLGAIRRVIVGAPERSSVVVTFSGHGSFVPDEDGDEADGTDEVICPHDLESAGPVTDDELHGLFSLAKPGVRVVLISDSCHSGTVSRYRRTVGDAAPARKARFLPPGAFLAAADVRRLGGRRRLHKAGAPGRHAALLLAGCQDAELSWDATFHERPNGAFTFAALRALVSLPAGATYRDWHARIRQALPSQEFPQSPNLYGSAAMKRWPVLG